MTSGAESIEQQTVAQPTRAAERTTFNGLQWGLVLLAVFNLAWTIRRMLPAFLPWDPALVPIATTACEEEALFSIWKFINGQPVYTDPLAVPFAVSYFNWLFYWVYGGLAKLCLSVFQLSPVWFPTITRCITVGIAVGCAAVTYQIAREAGLWPAHWKRISRVALVSLLFFNDLFCGSIATTRPDLGGLLLELVALWCALRYFRREERWMLLVTVLACYAAWAFKHNMVSVVSGLCLTLFFTRRRREMLFVIIASALLYLITFALGGSLYRFCILGSQVNCTPSFEQLFYVLNRGFDVAPCLAVVVIALLGTIFLRKQLPWGPNHLQLALTCAVSWALMLITSAKLGADYNYIFGPSVLGMLWVLHLYRMSASQDRTVNSLRFALPVALAAFAMVAARNITVTLNERQSHTRAQALLTERQKRAQVAKQPEWIELRRLIAELPAPVLITERRYNLPWVQSRAPHFVVGYTYSLDRKAGKNHEGGGLGGMIAQGYFKTIVVPVNSFTNMHTAVTRVSAGPLIDGQSLDRYKLRHSDRDFAYYISTDVDANDRPSSKSTKPANPEPRLSDASNVR